MKFPILPILIFSTYFQNSRQCGTGCMFCRNLPGGGFCLLCHNSVHSHHGECFKKPKEYENDHCEIYKYSNGEALNLPISSTCVECEDDYYLEKRHPKALCFKVKEEDKIKGCVKYGWSGKITCELCEKSLPNKGRRKCSSPQEAKKLDENCRYWKFFSPNDEDIHCERCDDGYTLVGDKCMKIPFKGCIGVNEAFDEEYYELTGEHPDFSCFKCDYYNGYYQFDGINGCKTEKEVENLRGEL